MRSEVKIWLASGRAPPQGGTVSQQCTAGAAVAYEDTVQGRVGLRQHAVPSIMSISEKWGEGEGGEQKRLSQRISAHLLDARTLLHIALHQCQHSLLMQRCRCLHEATASTARTNGSQLF